MNIRTIIGILSILAYVGYDVYAHVHNSKARKLGRAGLDQVIKHSKNDRVIREAKELMIESLQNKTPNRTQDKVIEFLVMHGNVECK